MQDISADVLNSMTDEELYKLYSSLPVISEEKKSLAWSKMDTGIYDSKGNLIGDKCEEEDAYEE